jgi:hypothetical protein
MDFQIWKVERKGSEKPWHSFSLRQGTRDIPTVLNQEQFLALFPTINPEDIPETPSTRIIRITARMIT